MARFERQSVAIITRRANSTRVTASARSSARRMLNHRFDQDIWVTALHCDKRNLRTTFEQYRAQREANVALLKILTPKQWKHHGLHNERGAESIETIVQMFAGHDLNHFQQIERILSAKAANARRRGVAATRS
jgi:hypothetical protein